MTQHDVLVRLMREHQHDVWRWLRYLGADQPTADDITQDTFIELYRNPIDEVSRASTSAWLRKAAKHRYLNWLRQRKQVPLSHIDSADEAWAVLTSESSDSRLEALEKCLEKLAERARRAIEGKYSQGRSEAEVAADLECSLDAAKALLKRAREQLRDCVQGRVQT